MPNHLSRNRTLENNDSSISNKGGRRSKIFPYEDSLDMSEAKKKQETLEDIILGNISHIYKSKERRPFES